MTLSKGSWTFEQMLKWAEQVAVKKGWQLNPNEEAVRVNIEGLIDNQRLYKRRYCPCRRVTRNPEKDKSIICPCIYSADEIEQEGVCYCGLFVKK
ncbi:MAG: ferredoxin-thioredoxin reductase catalytic domain-containing protein [Candidatus Hodarchaeota archaeon]